MKQLLFIIPLPTDQMLVFGKLTNDSLFRTYIS